jgi:hypothetical protein
MASIGKRLALPSVHHAGTQLLDWPPLPVADGRRSIAAVSRSTRSVPGTLPICLVKAAGNDLAEG